MRTHADIDERSLVMVRAIVEKIDADPERQGLLKARATCRRWAQRRKNSGTAQWLEILSNSWQEVRQVLLDPSEEGHRLRQNNPFCGVLTPQERWAIYRDFRDRETQGS